MITNIWKDFQSNVDSGGCQVGLLSVESLPLTPSVSVHVVFYGTVKNCEKEICIRLCDAHGRLDAEDLRWWEIEIQLVSR